MQRLYTTKPSHMRRRCINRIMCATRQIRAASRHLPSLDFYLYVGWYRTRRDVACNVSTPPNRCVCMDGASIVLCARPAKPIAASRHLPSLDFYLYVGWYRTRRDVACNVSTPPNHRICMDGASIVLCARPTKSVRHRAICHHWIFIYTPVGIAPVETLHATSLHHQTIAYA
jgi:ribulose-5-phosphate 4-epimerase/fuculose-1-phosphate aldolase